MEACPHISLLNILPTVPGELTSQRKYYNEYIRYIRYIRFQRLYLTEDSIFKYSRETIPSNMVCSLKESQDDKFELYQEGIRVEEITYSFFLLPLLISDMRKIKFAKISNFFKKANL